MAETNRLRAMEVFWSRDESDIDSSLVYVPGVSHPGNRRPTRPVKVTGRRTEEVKPTVPVARRPASESVKVRALPRGKIQSQKKAAPQQLQKPDQVDDRKVSLKDLCKEDKQRVANLINELARVGDEKHKVSLALNQEKLLSEQQMKDLVDQQERIFQERQAVQEQLWECQNLLSRYQKIVSHQQEVLSQQVSEHEDLDKISPGDGSTGSNGYTDQVPETDNRRQQNGQVEPVAHAGHKANTRHERPMDMPALPISVHPVASNTNNDQLSEHSSTPVAELSGGGLELETTPRGTNRKVRVPTSTGADSSDRPFTAYIDGLIAREQDASRSSRHESLMSDGNNRRAGKGSLAEVEGNSENSSSRATSSTSSRPYASKPPSNSSSRAPLHEPVLSSTHQSDLLSVSHQSRTKAGDFQPLLPDPSPRSSLHSSGTTITSQHPLDELSSLHYRQGPPPFGAEYPPYNSNTNPSTFHPGGEGFTREGLPPGSTRVKFSEHHIQHGLHPPGLPPGHQLSDADFVNYYRSMTPYERQRHLQVQKSALVAEQERLRQILDDQERLLESKQRQLHQQQEVQRRRLQHFEHTGAFPHSLSSATSSQEQWATAVDDLRPQPPSFPHQNDNQCPPIQIPASLREAPQTHAECRHYEEATQPRLNYSLHSDNEQIDTTRPTVYKGLIDENPNAHNGANTRSGPSDIHNLPLHDFVEFKHPAGNRETPVDNELDRESVDVHTLDPINNGAEISMEELEAVTESFENILFLERHGIDVTDMRTTGPTRNVHRPMGSHQVLSPGGGAGRQSSRPRVETMNDLLSTSRGSGSEIVERDGKKMTRKTSKVRSSPQQISEGEHVARLLDLVDQVESSDMGRQHHRPSHHASPGSASAPRYTISSGLDRALKDAAGGGMTSCANALEEEDPDESQILEDVFFVK